MRSTPVQIGAPVAFPGAAASVRHDPVRTGTVDVVVPSRLPVVAAFAGTADGRADEVEVTEGGGPLVPTAGATVDTVARDGDVCDDTVVGCLAFVPLLPHPAATKATTTTTMVFHRA